MAKAKRKGSHLVYCCSLLKVGSEEVQAATFVVAAGSRLLPPSAIFRFQSLLLHLALADFQIVIAEGSTKMATTVAFPGHRQSRLTAAWREVSWREFYGQSSGCWSLVGRG